MRGLSRKIQLRLKRIPGMMSGIRLRPKKTLRRGVFVRSVTQASSVPIANATTAVPPAKATEFPRMGKPDASKYALR